jgi:hypothetical protein
MQNYAFVTSWSGYALGRLLKCWYPAYHKRYNISKHHSSIVKPLFWECVTIFLVAANWVALWSPSCTIFLVHTQRSDLLPFIGLWFISLEPSFAAAIRWFCTQSTWTRLSTWVTYWFLGGVPLGVRASQGKKLVLYSTHWSQMSAL